MLEGVVAKRREATYQPGNRMGHWVKLRLDLHQEFVVGGYRPDGSDGFDALLVGYYQGGSLRFAGTVCAGFVPYSRGELLTRLKPYMREHPRSRTLPTVQPVVGVEV